MAGSALRMKASPVRALMLARSGPYDRWERSPHPAADGLRRGLDSSWQGRGACRWTGRRDGLDRPRQRWGRHAFAQPDV